MAFIMPSSLRAYQFLRRPRQGMLAALQKGSIKARHPHTPSALPLRSGKSWTICFLSTVMKVAPVWQTGRGQLSLGGVGLPHAAATISRRAFLLALPG